VQIEFIVPRGYQWSFTGATPANSTFEAMFSDGVPLFANGRVTGQWKLTHKFVVKDKGSTTLNFAYGNERSTTPAKSPPEKTLSIPLNVDP